jgi:hypothetical protein
MSREFARIRPVVVVQRALTEQALTQRIRWGGFLKSGIASSGWRTNLTGVGTYGADITIGPP